ncbi:type 1 glutamine amidotransferase [Asticcacaulis tiandongensis]|uniref:type 1 glutamine amidotransferase n=1 Tax=Asticcacaulis tiandongensis TaxID=2565365 RepID=UPI00112DC119|nr:type 1 glutamine amidotransferase [Asticcacaulis tiandongensis]
MSYIAILETGVPPNGLDEAHGSYADMFIEGLAGPGRQFRVFKTLEGELPPEGAPLDGVVITGSPAGVYEDDPWISDLIEWLKALDPSVPVAGICFGHQIMAQAWGGHVEKSDKGWGVGLHDYQVCDLNTWQALTGKDEAQIRVAVSHQDQVVKKPETAEVLATSDFTPNAALRYTDRKAISFQCHPEFSAAYARDLWEGRRHKIGDKLIDQAVESLEKDSTRDSMLTAISRFLEGK